jgi:L-threonylcarbamoyladenylate synthase
VRLLLLGSIHNPYEVAGNLYEALRQLDQEKAVLAWVDMDFPRHGLWQTIAERLMRAGEN